MADWVFLAISFLFANALIEIQGVKFFTADQPLRLEADPIIVGER